MCVFSCRAVLVCSSPIPQLNETLPPAPEKALQQEYTKISKTNSEFVISKAPVVGVTSAARVTTFLLNEEPTPLPRNPLPLKANCCLRSQDGRLGRFHDLLRSNPRHWHGWQQKRMHVHAKLTIWRTTMTTRGILSVLSRGFRSYSRIRRTVQ